MVKQPLTTRLDANVLALAKQLAEAERRSMTAIIELAVIEYARARGLGLPTSASE